MTVGELLEKLEQYPREYKIVMFSKDNLEPFYGIDMILSNSVYETVDFYIDEI